MKRRKRQDSTVAGDIGPFVKFFLSELKPRGKLLTPFNMITVPILLAAAVILVIRFAYGLGAVTNLSQEFPWGIWKGFNVVTGVAFAGGAYVLTFMVYVLRMEKYHPIVRVTVLNGVLAYTFYAGALLLELGRPWNVINPLIGNSFGVSSVLFLIAWHFTLYLIVAFTEFSPAVAEWLGMRRTRKFLTGLTLGAVIMGITLSTLHQSGLGALYLMAKGKIHPLWYSEMIPVLFFVSSIFAGLSMVIFEGTISRKVFSKRMSHEHHASHSEIVFGLAKTCAATMFVYLFLEIIVFIHGKRWGYINSPMGYLYLTEVVGLVAIPSLFFYLNGIKRRSLGLVRAGAILTILGIVLNRLDVSLIAFRWFDKVRYYPTWMEVEVSLAVIAAQLWVFRWVVNRMPVMSESPAWVHEEETHTAVVGLPSNEEAPKWTVTRTSTSSPQKVSNTW